MDTDSDPTPEAAPPGSMTSDAAQVVATLALGVDGGCAYCVRDLIEKLSTEFPEHADVFSSTFAAWASHLVENPFLDDPEEGGTGS